MSRESKATKDEIQRSRNEAYQGGWDDGYAEGFGKARADAAALAALAELRAERDALRAANASYQDALKRYGIDGSKGAEQ